MKCGAFIVVVLLQTTLILAEYRPCYDDIDECTHNLKKLLVDDSVFWFGDDFEYACPPGLLTPDCNNPDRIHHNIISRMYNLTKDDNPLDFVPEDIQVTSVTFNSPKGSYFACGHVWESEEAYNYQVDPTRVMTIGQWAMDHMPVITWDTKNDTDDQLYTMIVWDAGFWYTHGIYHNIKGTDLQGAESVLNYFGPKVPLLRPNVYVFAVFRQQEKLNYEAVIESYTIVFGLNLGSLPLLSFLERQPFIEPELVAANIMIVPGDAYGLQFQKDSYILNKCPNLISQAPELKQLLDASGVVAEWTQETNKMNNIPTPYLKTLTVDMTIVYELPNDVSVESCCNEYMYMHSKFIVDPLSTMSARSVQAMMKPRVKLTPINIMGDRYNSFKKRPYTLMLVDLMPQSDGTTNFVVHWMVNNIIAGNVDSGYESLSYVGPSPYERTKPHAYIFLLVDQTERQVDLTNWNMYISDQCPPFLAGRCGKGFGNLLKEFKLTLIRGVSWFTAVQDGYARKLLYSDYKVMMKDQVCRGVEGFETPCPKHNYNSGSNLVYGTAALLFTTFIAILKQF